MRRTLSRSLIALSMASLLVLPISASANAISVTNEVISPATETIINGVPESLVEHPIQAQDVSVGPIFDSYDPSYTTIINKHRLIVDYSHDNSRNAGEFKMEVSISSSESQGSEFSGSITFTGEVKAGIFGGISVSNGYSVKETRTKNEAVGVKGGPLTVPPYKWGYISMYYKAVQSGGGVVTYTYNTADPTKKYYKTTPVNVKVYKRDSLDIHTEAWTS